MIKPPVLLDNTRNLDGFDSGNSFIDSWFIKHAKQANGSGSARTYVVYDDDIPIGFYSLASGSVETTEVSERVSKGMGKHPIPVVILVRMAVKKEYQGKGIGAGMLKDAIKRSLNVAEQVGVRALLTHPIDENAQLFYERYGFEKSPLREGQLVLLLKDAKKTILDKNL